VLSWLLLFAQSSLHGAVHRRLGVPHFVVVLRQSAHAQCQRSHLPSVHLSLAARGLSHDSAARAQLNHHRPASEARSALRRRRRAANLSAWLLLPRHHYDEAVRGGLLLPRGLQGAARMPGAHDMRPTHLGADQQLYRPRRVHRCDCVVDRIVYFNLVPESSPRPSRSRAGGGRRRIAGEAQVGPGDCRPVRQSRRAAQSHGHARGEDRSRSLPDDSGGGDGVADARRRERAQEGQGRQVIQVGRQRRRPAAHAVSVRQVLGGDDDRAALARRRHRRRRAVRG
jgi:hypothetical protein